MNREERAQKWLNRGFSVSQSVDRGNVNAFPHSQQKCSLSPSHSLCSGALLRVFAIRSCHFSAEIFSFFLLLVVGCGDALDVHSCTGNRLKLVIASCGDYGHLKPFDHAFFASFFFFISCWFARRSIWFPFILPSAFYQLRTAYTICLFAFRFISRQTTNIRNWFIWFGLCVCVDLKSCGNAFCVHEENAIQTMEWIVYRQTQNTAHASNVSVIPICFACRRTLFSLFTLLSPTIYGRIDESFCHLLNSFFFFSNETYRIETVCEYV